MIKYSYHRNNAMINERQKIIMAISPKEFAVQVESDGRTVRKFLRSEFGTVGKGQRWAIEAKQVRSLKAKFAKWDDARRAALTADQAPADAVEVEAPAAD